MMKSRNSSLDGVENGIGEKTYLEFAVHLLELEYFNPIVFCHDSFWFNRKRYTQVMIGFINLLSFFYSCGITVETETEEPSDYQEIIYDNIMRDVDFSQNIVCYNLLETDFTCFDMSNARIPENCEEGNFALVKVYLQMRTGAAMNKNVIEKLTKRTYTDSEMITLRKQMENITGRAIVKRKDNSYEMR